LVLTTLCSCHSDARAERARRNPYLRKRSCTIDLSPPLSFRRASRASQEESHLRKPLVLLTSLRLCHSDARAKRARRNPYLRKRSCTTDLSPPLSFRRASMSEPGRIPTCTNSPVLLTFPRLCHSDAQASEPAGIPTCVNALVLLTSPCLCHSDARARASQEESVSDGRHRLPRTDCETIQL